MDLLRGASVFVMIETHVVNATLASALKLGVPFKILTFLNGLVAPTFLFCAGLAFAISFRRRWDDYVNLRAPFWRYLARILFILVVAYSLHLPHFSLQRLLALNDQSAWLPFFQSDILQVIALTLLFLAGLAVAARTERLFTALAASACVLLIVLSPPVRAIDVTGWPVWLRPYFSMQFRSQFPLFPWSAFLIGGTLIGFRFIAAWESGSTPRFMRRLALFGIALIVVSALAELQPLTLYANHDFWKASPEFFGIRFGLVVLMLWFWWVVADRVKKGLGLLTVFGQESLLVYTVHLLVVYGYTYQFSFVRMYGPTLGYAESLGLFALLTLVMFALAFVWHALKGWNLRGAKIVQVVVLGAIVLQFLFNPLNAG